MCLGALRLPYKLDSILVTCLLLGVLPAACSDTSETTADDRSPSTGDDHDDSEGNTGDDADNSSDDDDTGRDDPENDAPVLAKDAGAKKDAGLPAKDGGSADAAAVSDTGAPPARDGSAPGIAEGGAERDGAVAGGGEKKPPCLKNPSQVVFIGDSYVGAPVVLVPKVEEFAIADGALMRGQEYRDFGVPGATTGTVEAPGTIILQWEQAKAEDPDIQTMVMDGGGNDIFLSLTCILPGAHEDPYCLEIIDGIVNTVRNVHAEAKALGTSDLIYFLYPNVPVGGEDILEHAVKVASEVAAELSRDGLRVHLVDVRPTFEGHPEYFGLDPVHSNEEGSRALAGLLYQTMKDNCIAQPASSGCCEP